MMSQAHRATRVDDLVNAGENQTEADRITDFVFMARDVSNSYLVTTEDGDVLINAGSSAGAQRTKALYAAVSSAPVRYAIITQSHGDHYGGLSALASTDSKLVVSSRFIEGVGYRQRLSGFYVPRTNKLWHGVVGTRMDRKPDKPRRPFTPAIEVDDRFEFSLGGRRFVILTVPGGEALDGLAVWMPDERIVFIGNLLGPAYLNVPNLVTLRGDKPRSAAEYIKSVSRIRDLAPEILITGHGDPIRGRDRIMADLKRMCDAVQSMLDQTLDGMNAGEDVYTLMREVKLPPELSLEEAYGKVAWNVRTIWEEYAGWFHYDSTTAIYPVPRSAVSPDIVALAGGPDALAQRAEMHIEAGRPVEAMHLIDIALDAAPGHARSQHAKRAALQLLLDHGSDNLNEAMWLRSEIKALDLPGQDQP